MLPSIAEAYFFQEIDEARIGAQRVPVPIRLEVGQAPATFLVRLFEIQWGIVLAESEINVCWVTRRNICLRW